MPLLYSDLSDLHQLEPLVELYTLDLTSLGGAVYRFSNDKDFDGTDIVFGGHTYMTVPIQTTGWDFTSSGAPPKPTLTLSNVSKVLLADVIGLGDMVGATLLRLRTKPKYFDNRPTADSGRHDPIETYIIEQKIGHNKTIIQWQLTSPFDRLGLMLPRRQILKDKGFPGANRRRVNG